MVAEVIPETHDTTTLVLFTGNDRLSYKPGHFLTIDPHQFEALDRWIEYLEMLKGRKEKPRAYSISSAPHEPYLAFTVKEERFTPGKTKYPPLLSPILAKRTYRGTKLIVTGFTGPYVLPDDVSETTGDLIHICAGSGIVPNFSIMKHCLRQCPHIRHTLIYSNKTWESIIFRDQFIRLKEEYPDRVNLIYTITREAPREHPLVDVRAGRVTPQLVDEAIRNADRPLFMVCGPAVGKFEKKAAKEQGITPSPRFMESVLQHLDELNIPKKRIIHESYG